MNSSQKEKIITHFEDSLKWIGDLKHLTEDQWRMPIAKDKWTVAEVIGHLIPWDELFMERIPYLLKGNEIPPKPNIDAVNQAASRKSQEQSKEDIINNFIEVRKKLIDLIRDLDNELWLKEFNVESTPSLYSYFSLLAEHDGQHFNQIKRVLNLR